MRVNLAVVACSLICLLVDPVLAETVLVAKVYRDYPGYINPAVCENPNIGKPPAATSPQKIEIPLPVVTETAPGPMSLPATPSASIEPVTPSTVAIQPVVTAPQIFEAPLPVAPEKTVGYAIPEAAPPAPAAVIVPVEPAPTVPLVSPATEQPAAPGPLTVTVPLPVAPEKATGPAISETNQPAPAALIVPVAPTPTLPLAPPATGSPAAPVSQTITVPLPVVPETAAGNSQSCKPECSGYDAVHAPYLSVWAGVVATNDVDVDYQGHSSEAEIDNGFAGGVAAGYDFGKIRLEVEGSYRNSNAAEGDADLKVRALMANVYADFETGGTATPYLGAGVGVADVDIEDEDDQVLAGQAAAGILFAVTEKVAIDLGYRFMMTDDPDIDGAELELRQHTALLGVQIKF